jgi:acyl dehydratase
MPDAAPIGTSHVSTLTLEQLQTKIGEPVGMSSWHTIDHGMIDRFAHVTRDEQWIHIDPRRAAASPFGTTIAHGFLILSLCSHFLEECLEVRGVTMALNYGLNRVRFPSPVPSGARVRGQAALISLESIPGGAQAVIRMTIEHDRGDKPACVAELVARYLV